MYVALRSPTAGYAPGTLSNIEYNATARTAAWTKIWSRPAILEQFC